MAKGRFFNVALLDIRLPDMEGVELMMPLKALHPDMALILVTAYASLASAVQALKDGASAYVTKPVNMDELLTFIEKALEKQRLVAEKRRAEEAVSDSERRFRALIENGSDIVALVAPDGIVRYISPSVERVLGYAPGERVGRDSFEIVHPEDVPGLQEMMVRDVRHRRRNPRTVEYRVKHKDGTWRVFETTGAPHLDDPAVSAIVVNSRDVTERREAQRLLWEEEKKREVAVLEERNRIAREIHDVLAQGFTGIVWQLQAAEHVLRGEESEARHHMAAAIDLARESLQEARRSVQNLRPAALDRLALPDALRAQVLQFGQGIPVTTKFDLSGRVRPLPLDYEAALLRVCQEGLTNVRKHASASEIAVNLAYGRHKVKMGILDNGVGMDPKGAFSRGFGLTSMQERLRLLGGDLTLRSRKGRGTRLEVSLPEPGQDRRDMGGAAL